MNKKVSVIIPTYNQKKYLIEGIVSLLNQTYPVHEIIIVDNASTDGTDKAVMSYIHRSLIKKVNLIKNNINEGVTGGRNTGIKYVKGDYILFFDHDMVANKDMVEIMVKCLESSSKIGIVTPKIYFWDKKNIIWSAGTDVNLWTGKTIFYGGKDTGQYEIERQVSVAPAVLLVKKETLKKIDGFDEIYFATYEDTDFCFKAKKYGFITFYTPKAIAYHHIPYDEDLANKRLLNRAYWVGRNRIIFMSRYAQSFVIFLLFIPLYFFYYIMLAIKYKTPCAIINYSKGVINGFKAT